ncbi:hypothetical protein LINPERPRIM_LOCUS42590 [Linum perenne]
MSWFPILLLCITLTFNNPHTSAAIRHAPISQPHHATSSSIATSPTISSVHVDKQVFFDEKDLSRLIPILPSEPSPVVGGGGGDGGGDDEPTLPPPVFSTPNAPPAPNMSRLPTLPNLPQLPIPTLPQLPLLPPLPLLSP